MIGIKYGNMEASQIPPQLLGELIAKLQMVRLAVREALDARGKGGEVYWLLECIKSTGGEYCFNVIAELTAMKVSKRPAIQRRIDHIDMELQGVAMYQFTITRSSADSDLSRSVRLVLEAFATVQE